jgi:catechol 2,3-dioxygenase-like lactoylglutathione lyase family enzyme
MLGQTKAFSGMGARDIREAHRFYSKTLGVEMVWFDEENGLMSLQES